MEEHKRTEELFVPYRYTHTVLEEGWDKEINLRNMITDEKRRECTKRAQKKRIILEENTEEENTEQDNTD